ncbi:hypothetical protein BH23GEM9_BH23GEM9_00230 [soil metagenome]
MRESSLRAHTARIIIGACAAMAIAAAAWRLDYVRPGVHAAPTAVASAATAHAAASAPAVPVSPAAVRLLPERILEGTLFSVIVEGGDPGVKSVAGRFAGESLHFRGEDTGVLVAMAAAPLDSAGSRRLELEISYIDGSRDDRTIEVTVVAGEYRMERLSVAPQFGQPQPPELQRRIVAEAARARAVSTGSHETQRMWELPMIPPRDSRITSGFGHGRMFNGQVQSRHTGTDFAGAVGAPVRAPARGIVALVDDFLLGGGVIYIDHGAGLVTGYLHLSGKNVVEGDTVAAGQIIGRVGATGRVTGPHLHWIVRYGGHTVDGMSLLGYPSPSGR